MCVQPESYVRCCAAGWEAHWSDFKKVGVVRQCNAQPEPHLDGLHNLSEGHLNMCLVSTESPFLCCHGAAHGFQLLCVGSSLHGNALLMLLRRHHQLEHVGSGLAVEVVSMLLHMLQHPIRDSGCQSPHLQGEGT